MELFNLDLSFLRLSYLTLDWTVLVLKVLLIPQWCRLHWGGCTGTWSPNYRGSWWWSPWNCCRRTVSDLWAKLSKISGQICGTSSFVHSDTYTDVTRQISSQNQTSLALVEGRLTLSNRNASISAATIIKLIVTAENEALRVEVNMNFIYENVVICNSWELLVTQHTSHSNYQSGLSSSSKSVYKPEGPSLCPLRVWAAASTSPLEWNTADTW